jgi:Fe-S cluster assembly iron-binding protein IscA
MPIRRQSKGSAKSKKTAKPSNAKRGTKKIRQLIDRSMPVTEIISLHPYAADVLAQYGLSCANCALGGYESLEEGWNIHGLPEADQNNLIADLNSLLSGEPLPIKNEKLMFTAAAAGALHGVGKEAKKTTCMLRVMHDDHGGYCLEFSETRTTDDVLATHPDFPDVSLIADPKLLKSMGGATVDFREGRFKLDIGKNPAQNIRKKRKKMRKM